MAIDTLSNNTGLRARRRRVSCCVSMLLCAVGIGACASPTTGGPQAAAIVLARTVQVDVASGASPHELAAIPALDVPRGSPREDPDDDWGAEDDDGSALFATYQELVVSVGHVSGDRTRRNGVRLSSRAPGSYVGLDLLGTFARTAGVNREVLPDWLPLDAMDLHPRVLFGPTTRDGSFDDLDFAPQDFWLRFNPLGIDRLGLRVGQFVIPYGDNPTLAPRQRALLPVEAKDLGLKWDWGVGVKGPFQEFDWEVAATLGTGESWHSPRPLSGSDRRTGLITARIGAPTYRDLQYGLSVLYGDLPVIRGAELLQPEPISRRRIGLNARLKQGTYVSLGGQLTFGDDGVRTDAGATRDVVGYRAWLDWVDPAVPDIRATLQLDSVGRERRGRDADDTAVALELAYSMSTAVTLKLTIEHQLDASMGDELDVILFTLVFFEN